MTGRTTRTVDMAIQILFNEGKLLVPLNDKAPTKEYTILDPCYRQSVNVQMHLLERIEQRLISEHHYGKNFEGLDVKKTRDYVLISLKPIYQKPWL